MRLSTVGLGLASLLVATASLAAEGKVEKGASSSGTSTGGGDTGGGATTGADQFGNKVDVEADVATGEVPKYKKWEVSGSFEMHRLVHTDDVAGGQPVPGPPDAGSSDNKFMNAYAASVRYDLTPKDRIGVRAYVYQRFLADQGENGFRFDDMVVTYTRLVPLPEKFRLQVGLWATIPTSYDSQLSGTITSGRLSLDLDRWFGTLDLNVRASEEGYIQRYDSYAGSGGAVPNPLNRIAVVFNAEYHLPFLPALSAGLGLYTGWTWYLNIQTGNLNGSGVNSSEAANGIVQDPTYASQPIQQSYGDEVFVRYELPSFVGVKSDLSVAYAQGDPTIGYSSVLHDGVGHAYLGFYNTSEVYASLGVRY